MKILIVGNGGREHALLWKLRKDAPSAQFFVTLLNAYVAYCCCWRVVFCTRWQNLFSFEASFDMNYGA